MAEITAAPFGVTGGGEAVSKYTLQNRAGMCVSVLDYGCTVQSILVPDAGGKLVDVVLGYDDLAGYETGSCYFGALVGRCANRLRDARFTLNGRTYFLEANDGENHLHGVYSRQLFRAAVENGALVLRRLSPDGEEGYPGAVRLEVRCSLREDNALVMDCLAETDADTLLNLTNHTYFNLNGQDGSDILGHRLTLAADSFTEVGPGTLPTGRILPVEGTPLDFRAGKRIGEDIFTGDPQLSLCRGYDHNYVLGSGDGRLLPFARAAGDRSGICLRAFTTQPGVQLYTGNYVDEDTAPRGKRGLRYPRYGGFCLETQHYPCAPSYPQFPSILLRPGELYRQRTIYQFSI